MQNRKETRITGWSLRFIVLVMLLGAALLPAVTVHAQSPSVEWLRWDANINVQSNDQMQIAETQEVQVVNGTVSKGSRFWTDPVNVQAVYIITDNDGTPRQVNQSSSNQPNTYQITDNNGQTTLNYFLPAAQQAGSTFIVQINYTATTPTTGMVDWKIVPAEHNFNVRSSNVSITFPNGQAPDQSLIRASTQANVQVNGDTVTIQSTGPIGPSQAFAIQVPFGAGVGAANNSNNSNSGVNNGANSGLNGDNGIANPLAPGADTSGAQSVQLPGFGTILLVICVVGFLLLWGGGSLLRNLLGGLGGGNLGGNNYPGGGYTGRPSGGVFNNPFGGGPASGSDSGSSSGLNRGFRSSPNQDRSIGDVGDDKDSGGGASFG
jgi:hypothetical protein